MPNYGLTLGRSRRRAPQRLAALALALASTGCSAPPAPEQRFELRLRASTTGEQPLAGVRFWADGRELGTTAADGSLRVQLRGREGRSVALSSACPPAYRTPVPARRLVLRRIAARAPLELSTRCEPLERKAAIVVRVRGAGRAGLPIRVGGESVGQTDADGLAHVLLTVHPHSALRVQLVTTAHPRLLPRDPVQTFEVEDEDCILLVDQALLRPARSRRVTRAPPDRPRLPYRID